MSCIVLDISRIFRSRWQRDDPSAQMQNAISAFIFNGAERRDALRTLSKCADGPHASILADLLRRHLEPRWSDPDHAIRERLTIEIFSNLVVESFVLQCAKNQKLFDLLNYHLRACTFINIVGTQQLFLARRIQKWLNTVVDQFGDMEADLSAFFDLQKSYLRAWQEIDARYLHCLRSPRTAPARAVTEPAANDQGLLQRRCRASHESFEQLKSSLSDANILCFDILRMMMRPLENQSLIVAAVRQAGTIKLNLAAVSQLQVQTHETQSESAFRGNVVDTILRLDYCISMVAACESRSAANKRLEDKAFAEQAPPVYKYRV